MSPHAMDPDQAACITMPECCCRISTCIGLKSGCLCDHMPKCCQMLAWCDMTGMHNEHLGPGHKI